MTRILVGGLFHEGNSFSPLTTKRESFVVTQSDELLKQSATAGGGLGGAYRQLVEMGATILPAFKATSCPGGPVEQPVYEAFRDMLVEIVRDNEYDGIYLELHGSMLTTALDDPEGDLLEAVRATAGPDIPIAASLDLHGYVTARMQRNVDILLACKVNPHSDFDRAGALAATLLMRMLRNEIRPESCLAWIPLFIGAQMETATGPLAELHTMREELLSRHPALLDISIFNTQPLLDAPGGGQTITVIANDDIKLAENVASQLANAFWDRRDAFKPIAPSLIDVLNDMEAGRIGRPVVLGDNGDGVLAGTPGDNTAIIHELLSHRPHLRAVVPVTDPDVVEIARKVGIGNRFSSPVGGAYTRGVEPVTGDWEVVNLTDGRYIMAGPLMANEAAELGDTAILRQGTTYLMVTSLPGFTHDIAAFQNQGIDPEDFDVVVAKSAFHYKLSFEKIGHCVTVDTPGITSYKKGTLPFVKKINLYPEHPMTREDIEVRRF